MGDATMGQLGFYHNADICIGCKACIVACKDKNDLPLGEKFRRVYDYANCDWDVDANGVCTPSNVFAYSVSIACNHCDDPACLAVCPAGALAKREVDGIVWRDEKLCIGCGSCESACPYGASYVSAATGTARKCDFCMDLIDRGEDPYCVAACSMRCLEYGDIEELRGKYGDVSAVAPIPKDTGTGPNVVFTPSRLNPDGALEGTLLNEDQEVVSETVK